MSEATGNEAETDMFTPDMTMAGIEGSGWSWTTSEDGESVIVRRSNAEPTPMGGHGEFIRIRKEHLFGFFTCADFAAETYMSGAGVNHRVACPLAFQIKGEPEPCMKVFGVPPEVGVYVTLEGVVRADRWMSIDATGIKALVKDVIVTYDRHGQRSVVAWVE